MTGDADPFATAALRERVLATWRSSPVRLREDANAEEDSARDAYRDRLVVELAQNAVDAARRAGAPGRLDLLRADGALYAANPGAALDRAGVEALSHRRVSTKGAADIGRFGVGFSAVLAVTDEPSLHTASGGVGWSRSRTLDVLREVPEVTAELARRGAGVPVMRLPWTAQPDATVRRLLDAGAATVARLPFRDADAEDRAVELLETVDPLLLLFLDLIELTVDGIEPHRRMTATPGDEPDTVVLRSGAESSATWLRHRVQGDLPAELHSDRPVEERERASWTVTWAFPIADGLPRPHTGDHRLRAPQPLDDVVALPAVLCASVPVDSGRRHVVSSDVTTFVGRAAASAYAELLAALPPGPHLVDLLPSALPGGAFDLSLRDPLADALGRARLLASAADADVRLRGDEALVVDVGSASGDVTELLAPHVPRLVTPDHVAGGRRQAALVGLGARLLGTADVVDLLGAVDAEPAWWGDVLAALASAPDRESLRGLPLPLADGSAATDLRRVLLPGDAAVDAALAAAGLGLTRLHPDVVADRRAADLLRALGARDPEPAAVLDDPRVRGAVETALDDLADGDDPERVDALADAVLALLGRDPAAAADRDWLADLPLRDASGTHRAAGELLLPRHHGGVLVDVVDLPDGPFGVVADSVVERHGAPAVMAAGVLRTFATVTEQDVPVAPGGSEHYLDSGDEWLAHLADSLPEPASSPAPWVLDEVAAVRDLELVRADVAAWSAVLDELAGELRRVVLSPVVALHEGRRAQLTSYTAWWLRGHACVPAGDGTLHRPDRVAVAEAEWPLSELFPVATGLSAATADLTAQLGAIRRVPDLDADQVSVSLERLGRSGPALGASAVRDAYAALLHRAEEVGAEQPSVVCALAGTELVAVPAVDAVAVDAPDLLPLLGSLARVPVALDEAAALGELIGVDLASDAVIGRVVSEPAATVPVPTAVRTAAPSAPTTYLLHDVLLCEDAAGSPVRVGWRVAGGVLHVDRSDVEWNLSRAVATAVGDWSRRHVLFSAAVVGEQRADELSAEAELD